jgi:flotillin
MEQFTEWFSLVFAGVSILALFAGIVFLMMIWRRVVPTNMVHIVQSSKKTTPYGRGKTAGNTYYEIPSWMPFFGVTVTQFPESIFKVTLDGYDSYDAARLPFVVDVAAFFRVDNAETAAQRVSNFSELNQQLTSVVQGAVRRILATNELEKILESRAELGNQFTLEVKNQITEWGVLPVKMIEFMDIKDARDSNVIANIMAKEKSRIEMESRIKVAENNQFAKLKEIDATRTVEVQKQDAEQQVGLRTAEKDKMVGIADQKAKQDIQEQAKITAEKDMAVKQVNAVKSAEIDREVAGVKAEQDKTVATIKAEQDKHVMTVNAEADKIAKITNAEANKLSTTTIAEGQLNAALNEAEGVRANGIAKADAEKAFLMAPVEAQISLAQEIGSNDGYQHYLISVKQVEAGQAVGLEMAKAMQNADLKVIANAGDPQLGIAKIGDLFTTGGGTNLTGMLAALAQTDEGKALVNRFTGIKPE